jgi:REP element-mobilizing transposase RayT
MFRYVSGMIHARDSRLYQVNGTLDHVHILTGLHPARSLADFVKEIKVSSSHWIKTNGTFAGFPAGRLDTALSLIRSRTRSG